MRAIVCGGSDQNSFDDRHVPVVTAFTDVIVTLVRTTNGDTDLHRKRTSP